MEHRTVKTPVLLAFTSAALEVLFWVAIATGLVALLDKHAPVTALGSIYLLAVLAVAVRRGQLAAMAAAALGVVALNFFFVQPLHRFEIADSEDVVALTVLLIAALVVGRLAGTARERAAEAERRAALASAREREAVILADAATSLLNPADREPPIEAISADLAAASEGVLRLAASSAPDARGNEVCLRLRTEAQSVWLYSADPARWSGDDLARLDRPLARLLDVAAERKRAAEQSAEMEASQRAEVAKTAVLHSISHDLRSPLTAIRTAASGLGGEVKANDRDALISVIDEEAERLAGLVDNLLELSRIEAGAARPRFDWCDLGDVVARAAAQVQLDTEAAEIDLALPPDLPLVRADSSQLERVFTNLLENAVKFSPPGAPVRVSGGSGTAKVTLRIIDQGPGVPASMRARIFEPFFRGGRGGGGTGLGLAICRGFVEANDGEITLQADAPDGTSFAVSFPLVEQPAAVR
jgi:two-component system, OmpR family, sensor histidine kinase KdpD